MKKIENINTLDKWDLTKFYKTEVEINKDIEDLNTYCLEILNLKEHILDNYSSLEKFLNVSEKLEIILERLSVYGRINFYQDMTNASALGLREKINKAIEDVVVKLSFVEPELLKSNYDYIKSLIINTPLIKYDFYFIELFRSKKYSLSEEKESVLSKALINLCNSSDIFENIDNTDIKLGSILLNNKKIELTSENYHLFLNNEDASIRRSAFKKLYKYYKNLNNTLSSLYLASIKESSFVSDLRGYNSVLDMSLFEDNISTQFYDNLTSKIHNGIDTLRKYELLRKKYLNIKNMHMYDLYLNLENSIDIKIPFAKGKDILFDVLKPLGKDYLKVLENAFKEKWIDKYENIGKRSGAYEIAAYNISPCVSINYMDDFNSVSTLAHELGHAMHSYYSNKTQDFAYHNYSIFLAEIASTVNECLIDEYFINNAKSKKEKIYYLNSFLEKFRTTVFRQLMFSEFETKVYTAYQNGTTISPEYLNNTYLELNKFYYGNTVIYDDEIKYEWSRIPHFYSPFYVYKYASGFIIALSIISKLKKDNNYYKKYIEFLSSGSSKYPLDTLKLANIDNTLEEPIKDALEIFDSKVKELENLVGGNNNGKE